MKVLIVDDEAVARRGMRRELDRLPGVSCVGECGSPADAVRAIVDRAPDVVLLDIQLGRRTAFEIIEEVGIDAMPLVIFVTAYDRHAVRAFEVQALDYVLKPVDPDRLREALDRAASRLTRAREASLADRLERLLAARGSSTSSPAPAAAAGRLVVRDGERSAFLDLDRIDWVESAGNYVQVHAAGRTYVIRTTMDRLARRLTGADRFVRVRRSALVNVRAVGAVERYGKGTWVVHLRGGAKVISSRYYQPGIRRLLDPAG